MVPCLAAAFVVINDVSGSIGLSYLFHFKLNRKRPNV